MNTRYRFDQRPARQKRRRIVIVFGGLGVVIAIVGGLFALDIFGNHGKGVEGQGSTVLQTANGDVQHAAIDEPLFSMELPDDWRQISHKESTFENTYVWQTTSKTQANRSLILYIDFIPADKALNRIVAVAADGTKLMVGDDASDNCSNFTVGGTQDLAKAVRLKPTLSKYQQVDFICNLPDPIDNQVGSGSIGAINSVTLKGPKKGTHKYFFVYTEHNLQTDYNIFIDALRSFHVK